MNQDVKLAPLLSDRLESFPNLGVILDITRQKDTGSEGFYQFFDFFLKATLLIRQIRDPQICPSVMQLLGNTPSNGAIVGNASDKSVFSSQIEHNIQIG